MAANVITKQTIIDGSRKLVVKIHLDGHGVGGDEVNTVIVDASAYTPPAIDMKIVKIQSNLAGFVAHLIWNATANVDAFTLDSGESSHDFSCFGGLINNAGAGKNGDILLSTVGVGATDEGTIILTLEKR